MIRLKTLAAQVACFSSTEQLECYATRVQLTADGRQLLASIEDLTLPLRASSIVPLGYVYHKVAPGKRQKGHSCASPVLYMRCRMRTQSPV